jgi:stalled ribosome alternative rescue factor ArfA
VFIGLPLFRDRQSINKKRKGSSLFNAKNKGVADISTEMSLDVKSVYNIRQRIEVR